MLDILDVSTVTFTNVKPWQNEVVCNNVLCAIFEYLFYFTVSHNIMGGKRQETSLDKILNEKCHEIDPIEHLELKKPNCETSNILDYSKTMFVKTLESSKVICTCNPHSLERLATMAIFNFISDHGVNDTDLFFGSLPLPQSFLTRIKEQFEHDTETYFVNFIEPTINYGYPNEY